jgi:ferric-dicitrate binding protein FerR (iron transport regulator)
MSLIDEYLDDTISPEGLRELLDRVRSDGALRKEFVEALRMRGLLRAGIGPDASCERLAEIVGIAIPSGRPLDAAVMETIEARGLKPLRRPSRWTRLAAGIAAAWAVAIGLWIVLHETPAVRLAAAGEGVRVVRSEETLAARPGLSLRPGDRIEVPARSWASVRYDDGSTLQLGDETRLEIEEKALPPNEKRVRLRRGSVSGDVAPQPAERPMVLATPHADARVLGTAFRLSVAGQESRLLVHHGRIAFGTAEVTTGQAARAASGGAVTVEPAGEEVLRKLGRAHVMLGAMSGLGETWIAETRAQGCRWDLRYQHLTPEWTAWNKDAGFPTLYLQECERLGTVAVFTYYALMKKREPENAAVMKRYFDDLKTFFRRTGEHGKACILHVEPGAWASLAGSAVAVRSSGHPELQALDDSAESFGKAIGLLRDRLAPNVLLAWHASKVESAAAAADQLLRSGTWDLVFTDVGDRDSGFNDAHGKPGTGWSEKEFRDFRAWGAELHARTGLPLLVWRIPLGNTVMAACNNTPWHYMDNRVEYWLEGYPADRRIADWAEAGFVGYLFGGGAIGCTVHKDNAKDGVSNPPPVPGNKGETSTFPDDDGGYLRLRAGRYYQNGPHPLPIR